MKKFLTIFIAILTLYTYSGISAASPDKTLGFQGQLFESNTAKTGSVNATFTFYDSLSGGSVTGSPIVKTVTVSNGYFGTQFTESDTTGVNFNQQLYLEVTINGTTLSPRTTVNPTVSSLKSFGTFSYTSAPTVGPAGSLYFNTTDNVLYTSNGTSWQSAGIASSSVLSLTNGGTGATTTSNARENLGLEFASINDVTEAKQIVAWGDSLTQGAGATPNSNTYPAQLATLTGYTVYNQGVGGESSSQIKARFDADVASHALPTIFWVGRNDSDNTLIKSNIASMVAALGHSNYLVLGVINSNSEITGTANYTRITQLNNDLASIYGNRFIDMRKHIISQYNPNDAQDVIDYNNDVPPTSLSADGLHLNNAGYLTVATRVKRAITTLTGNSSNVATAQLLNYFFANPPIIGSSTRNKAFFSQVAIGTSSAISNFDIDGGQYLAKTRFNNQGFDANLDLYASRGSGVNMYNPWRIHANSGSTSYFSIMGQIASSTLGAESLADYFTIGNTGNVGIGTNNASALLEIATTSPSGAEMQMLRIFKPTDSSGTDGARITFANFTGGTNRAAEIAAIREGGSFGTSLVFRTNQGASLTDISEVIRIDSGGRLKIGSGVTTPDKLQINLTATTSTSFTSSVLLRNAVSAGGFTPGLSFAAGTYTWSAIDGVRQGGGFGGGFRVLTQDSTGVLQERLRVNSNGNLVIGSATNSIIARLSIVGTSSLPTLPLIDIASSSGTTLFRINSDGNVGIGTTTPFQGLVVATGSIQSTALLGGATTLSTDANGNIIRTPSDSKLKTNVETLTSALDKVNQMRGVSYNWIDTNRFGTSSEIGFIAQELETIVPEVVKSGGEYKSVNYQNLTALLTEAIKELSAKVTAIAAWFDGKTFTVHQDSKFQMDGLMCADDVCITKDQFKNLLRQASQNGGSTFTDTTPTTPVNPEPVAEVGVETTPEPEAVETPAIPEPVPTQVENISNTPIN